MSTLPKLYHYLGGFKQKIMCLFKFVIIHTSLSIERIRKKRTISILQIWEGFNQTNDLHSCALLELEEYFEQLLEPDFVLKSLATHL